MKLQRMGASYNLRRSFSEREEPRDETQPVYIEEWAMGVKFWLEVFRMSPHNEIEIFLLDTRYLTFCSHFSANSKPHVIFDNVWAEMKANAVFL